MKKLFSTTTILFLAMQMYAQIDPTKGTLSINGYEGDAALSIINNNALKVQRGTLVDTILLTQNGANLSLANAADSAKLYQSLQLSPQQLETVLQDIAGNTAVEKLLDITSKMKNQKLVILKGNDNVDVTNTPEEGAAPAPVLEENTSNNWLMPLLIGVGALVLGFILGKVLSKKPEPVSVPEPIVTKETKISEDIETVKPVKVSASAQKEIEKLTAELNASKEKVDLITEKTNKLIEGDNIYYSSVFEKMIIPLQTALDQENESEVIKYMNLATIQLSSITRKKIRKKLNYDDANIQLITGNASLTNDFPTIDQQTPIDKIPSNVRVFKNILQKNGVTSLGDAIIKGYKLKGL